MEPRWVSKAVLLAVHDAQIAEHGGGQGVRDERLLEATLARPRNLFHDGEPDIATLAAACAHGLARNHPFADGNKRTSLVACELFLVLNGHELTMEDAEAVTTWLALAAEEMEEEALAGRLRGAMAPVEG